MDATVRQIMLESMTKVIGRINLSDFTNEEIAALSEMENKWPEEFNKIKVAFFKSLIPKDERKIYGKWTVIDKADSRSGNSYLLCRCECGKMKEVAYSNLSSGASLSCGQCSTKIQPE